MDLDGQGSPQPSLFQPWMCVLYSTLPSLTKTKAKRVETLKTSTKCLFLYFILKGLHQCITMQYIAILIFRGELPFSNAFAWLTDPSQRGLNFDRLVNGRPNDNLLRLDFVLFLKQWFCESDACRWPGWRDILTQMTFWDANDLLDDRRPLMRVTQDSWGNPRVSSERVFLA